VLRFLEDDRVAWRQIEFLAYRHQNGGLTLTGERLLAIARTAGRFPASIFARFFKYYFQCM
jgi:hypothetical protein